MIRFLEKFIIWEFILFSGGVVFNLSYPRFCMVLFLLTSLVYYKKYTPKNNNRNLLIILIIDIWIILNHIVINPDTLTNEYISLLFYFTGSFFAISAFSFERFKHLILRSLVQLSIVSILVQIAHVFFHLPSHTYNATANNAYGMALYLFNVDWGENRLASIYWEPGQFQIILIYVLCLHIKELCNINELKANKYNFGILFVALIMTNSTTGYFSLAIIITIILLFSNITKKYKSLIPISIITSCILSIFIYNSSVVQDKLNQSKDRSEETSFAIRMIDNQSLLNIAKDAPITGVGIQTKTFNKKSLYYGNRTSSNGWLYAAATLGIPYMLFLLLNMIISIKKMRLGVPVFIIIIPLIVSQANEWMTWCPYLLAYIFNYRQYNDFT